MSFARWITLHEELCANKVYKSTSKTRELLVWPSREKQMVVDKIINVFPFFNRYTLERA